MRKPSDEDKQELYEYMVLFDMTESRSSGREPHAVPERLMESFLSSKGFRYQEIASFGTSRNNNSPSNKLEVMQYSEYVTDSRYITGEFASIGKMPNNMKLYLHYPSYCRDDNRIQEKSQSSFPRNTSPYNGTPMEITRDEDRQITLDPFAIDKIINAKPELISKAWTLVNERVNVIRKIFAVHFPTYYMKFTPFGSSVSGIAFPNANLNINIEMDMPDMIRLLQGPSNETLVEPHNFEYMSKVLKSVGATKIKYDPMLSSTSFRLDYVAYEYVFNQEIATKSTDLIKQYLKLDSRVLPFIKTLKFFAYLSNNSIRSYAYVIMALSFLVSVDPPVLPNLQNINHRDITDFCMSNDCMTKKMFWETAIHKGTLVGATARFHDCIKYDADASPCSHRVKKNGNSLYWNSSNRSTVGQLFIDFMYYYGYEFDYKRFAVSLKMGGVANRKEVFKNNPLVIEDPVLSGVNLGAGIVGPQGLQKFQCILRGAFTLLYGGVSFEQVITNTQDIQQYSDFRGVYSKQPRYKPFLRIVWTPSTKTIALVGLPKIPEQNRASFCYCDRIRSLFASYGIVNRLIDLDYTVKQVTFTDAKRNVNNILIPTSFTFDGKEVYLVELYDTITQAN
ncbi:hypothetical protein [Parasitella parasitica]|uniref:PAP-associated domain-containing protein n=1 Tax=Parasitella parasitica TaxID=35722 RepID=A0A0B7NMR5_9FUNG|nr:hypothetical protein [Parasitella parasitica]